MRALRQAIGELSSTQGGLFTGAQTRHHRFAIDGPSLEIGLRALVGLGEIEPVAPDVFHHLATAHTPGILTRAAWLTLSPEHGTAELRNRAASGVRPPGVIGGRAAAQYWDIDTMLLPDFVWVPTHPPRSIGAVHFMQTTIPAEDTHWSVDGYPFTSVERTLLDGLLLDGDLEHVASAFGDALWSRHALDLGRLHEGIEPNRQLRAGTLDLLLEMAGGLPHQDGLQYGERRWRLQHDRPYDD